MVVVVVENRFRDLMIGAVRPNIAFDSKDRLMWAVVVGDFPETINERREASTSPSSVV